MPDSRIDRIGVIQQRQTGRCTDSAETFGFRVALQ